MGTIVRKELMNAHNAMQATTALSSQLSRQLVQQAATVLPSLLNALCVPKVTFVRNCLHPHRYVRLVNGVSQPKVNVTCVIRATFALKERRYKINAQEVRTPQVKALALVQHVKKAITAPRNQSRRLFAQEGPTVPNLRVSAPRVRVATIALKGHPLL